MIFVLEEKVITDKDMVRVEYSNGLFKQTKVETSVVVIPGDILIHKDHILNEKQSSYITILLKVDNNKRIILTNTFFKEITPLSLIETTFNRGSVVPLTEYEILSNVYPTVSEVTIISNMLMRGIEDFSLLAI